MASSSVSQDDIDTDFEKNSRRSRIRTARAARQINSSSSSCRAELLMGELADLDHNDAEEAPCSALNAIHSTSCNSHSSAGVGKMIPEEDSSRRMRGGVKKGKQHRERRKLREKRRSTGVVHLASTESTGGSTTPDDAESSDNETKRNTLLNESDNVLLPTVRQAQQQLPSDLEADDENDTEQSYHNNSNNHSSNNLNRAQPPSHSSSSSLLPLSSPTPTPADEPKVEKVVEENKRLLSMMDEKDKLIHHLEFKIEQLMKDTLSINEEQSRLQKENKSLLRALNNYSTTTASETGATENKEHKP
uniref:PRKC apoptosis WT1 regulator protein n=1 Tax=Lepeophtheirus salmonis TaxID=72036 RepID=A0A0K2UTV8_LEPSM